MNARDLGFERGFVLYLVKLHLRSSVMRTIPQRLPNTAVIMLNFISYVGRDELMCLLL